MKAYIMDKGYIYSYEDALHISIMHDSNEMVIDYVDENGEKHEEVGAIPEYLTINECSRGELMEAKELNDSYLAEIRTLKEIIMKLKGEMDGNRSNDI